MFCKKAFLIYKSRIALYNKGMYIIFTGGGEEVEEIVSFLEILLENIASIAIVLFEFIGVAIIIRTGVMGFVRWLRHDDRTGIYLAQGLAMGLEFKMGSEILRTVIVRQWQEIVTVAGIIALRAALTFLLHWEIKEERRNEASTGKQPQF